MPTLAETERAVGRALRELARDTEFSVFQRSLIWQEGDLVAEVRLHGVAQTLFQAKPHAWDMTLWDILQIHDTVGRSVTRHWKQFTTPVPMLDARSVKSNAPVTIATAILDHAKAWQGSLAGRVPLEFPALFAARRFDEQPWHFVLTEVVWLITCRRDEEARAVCEAVMAGTRDSRFSIHAADRQVTGADGQHPHLGFFELALRWLEREGRVQTRQRARGASDSGG